MSDDDMAARPAPPAWPPPPPPPPPRARTRRGPTAKDVGQGVLGGGVVVLALLGVASLVSGGEDRAKVRTAASAASASPTATPEVTPSPTPPAAPPEAADAPAPVAAAAPATPSPLPVPVLDSAAVQACAVYAQAVADVVTKQDRSDLARGVNHWARRSAEPQLVSAAQALTDHADSWTGLWWSVAKVGFVDVCRRGSAAAVAAVPTAAPSGAATPPPSAADTAPDEDAPPPPDEAGPPEPEEEPDLGCLPVGDVYLDLLPSRPAGGLGELVLPSAWSVQGAHGHVIGGFLSSADDSGEVDGEFGAWFVTDEHVYAYSDAALTRTDWPVADGGDASERVAAVRACAEGAAG